MAEINVTPLVDVMLVLLAIFMVTAPLLAAGVPVQLPESNANPLPQEPKAVTVTLTADGKSFLDQSELAPGELPDRLAALMPRDGSPPPQVTLRADRSLAYGEVMAAMGEMNHVGIKSISLVTDSSVTAP
jgi:biopolymer transport protein TolR